MEISHLESALLPHDHNQFYGSSNRFLIAGIYRSGIRYCIKSGRRCIHIAFNIDMVISDNDSLSLGLGIHIIITFSINNIIGPAAQRDGFQIIIRVKVIPFIQINQIVR